MFSCKQKRPAPEKEIAGILLEQIDRFAASCSLLQTRAESNTATEKDLQELFLQARVAYKKFEWAAEYFEPSASRGVNGPPVQEVERSGQIFEPAGLQLIEGYLFPKADTGKKEELIKQLRLLQAGCSKYKTHFANIDIFDWQVFDAAKLEVFRIMTLGITGFDNPVTLKSMAESAASLESLQKIIAFYPEKEGQPGLGKRGDLGSRFDSAIRYLTNHPDFNSFDRAEFINSYGNPVTIGLTDLAASLNIMMIRYNRLLNQDAQTLFDSNAFNINAYLPDRSSFLSKEKIVLGKILFADQTLSSSGTRSCQTCHRPEKAFTDGLVKNTVIGNNKSLTRNTPTLLNAALQSAQFYDLRVNTLEDQSLMVVQNTQEMHGSMKLSAERLWQDKAYRQLFVAAFPKKDRTGIDTLEIMNALGSYVRSLVALNSPFDAYMRGNPTAINASAINGFNLFMGKAKCATCHYMPLFNGTFPPRFIKTEAEVIGVPQTISNDKIDSDPGRYAIIRVESFRHAFKTLTVRNAAKTAPYMHNGVFTSLRQVIDFYNKGGGKGLGLKIDNQTLPFDKLDLTPKEIDDLISFIKSLDSELSPFN
ncbi:cytochrome-c peroxidase [Flavitalea flava]